MDRLDIVEAAGGATKAAIRDFVRAWTVEIKDRRIRSNVLSPGPTDTPQVTRQPADAIDERRVYAARNAPPSHCGIGGRWTSDADGAPYDACLRSNSFGSALPSHRRD
jgi:NAD(P)-dependent dehydrogenase (short-subunit alcohol dehydrogenase family)